MDDNLSPAIPDRAPVILDRGHHPISRRDIDPDALKVLYRLSNHGFTAYLVGGAVRDLLLGRQPADFDVGTNAHPNQIKKLFRNAFLIGRRFRLAHIRFQGGKIIEVSTFRRKPDEAELEAEREEDRRRGEEERAREASETPDGGLTGERRMDADIDGAAETPVEPRAGLETGDAPAEDEDCVSAGPAGPGIQRTPEGTLRIPGRPPLKPIAFGTPQEDAFRRDITINALFYDIATYSVIDYVGGLDDLKGGRIRIIGDPYASFTEDPVRIWRVLRHAARLGFTIEEQTEKAIPARRDLLSSSAGSRLYEELNKDMKSGTSRPFLDLARSFEVLPVILGTVGGFYQHSDDVFAALGEYLAVLDKAIARGAAPGPEIIYSLLIWPWARTILPDAEGDTPRVLFEAFREAKPAALIPKGILIDVFQTLVIVEHMVSALSNGQMRWALKKRTHYPAASKLCALFVQGEFSPDEDPFERIYRSRFESGAAPKKRRRRPSRRGFHRPPTGLLNP